MEFQKSSHFASVAYYKTWIEKTSKSLMDVSTLDKDCNKKNDPDQKTHFKPTK